MLIEVKKDGGWAWVVLIASFLVQMLIDGSFSMFGIFFVEMQEDGVYSNETISRLSLPGAVQTGAFQATGVIASCLLNHLSYRVVALIGFGLSSISLIVSSFVMQLELFTLTYGFLTGCGFGVTYVVAIVTVNFYFERYRAVASGISMSGAGVGYLISGPITKALLVSMSWRRVVLCLGFINFAFNILAFAFRPLRMELLEVQMLEVNGIIIKDQPIKESVKHKQFNQDEHNTAANTALNVPTIRIECPSVEENINSNSNCDLYEDDLEENSFDLSRDRMINSHFISTPGMISPTTQVLRDEQSRLFRSGNDIDNGEMKNHIKSLSREKIWIAPLSLIDIFYTGSFKSLASQTQFDSSNQEIVKSFSSNLNNIHFLPQKESFQIRFKRYSTQIKLIDFNLFRIAEFNIIHALSFFIQLAYFIPFVYLINYATKVRGIPVDQAVYLLVILGATHTVGRVSSGIVANMPSMNLAGLSTFGALTCAVGNLILPSLITFKWLCGYAAWHGFTSAINMPTTSLLLVHYLGLERLTSSFGVINFGKSFACIIGPYMAGFLCEIFVNPGTPFYLASGSLFISAVIHLGFLIIHLLKRK